ncbi:ankyrin repeat domain-containing protein 2-like [Xenia sp. Carnegie-2017]|uniref:ankyrin repeat domain-containing protein 2-like n=1 Tax=Xenia sp. Carnegie-2017 TaxID=2897299 RepID=UPI001F04F4B9|nr:ankyrin repeat domain-containing protein 2-like [Xenia sp. Carnegie-2017]
MIRIVRFGGSNRIMKMNRHSNSECPSEDVELRTRVFVKMKVVRKTKLEKREIRQNGAGIYQGKINKGGQPRRRLSDHLETINPAPVRTRRRSVSFDPVTVLKTAILENDFATTEDVLMSGKLNIDLQLDGVLPVVLAAREGCTECLDILIQNGVSIDVQDKRGCTPLELAVQGGHYECAQMLIAAGASDNSIRNGYFDEAIENGRYTDLGRRRSRTF